MAPDPETGPGPLAGVRILDLSRVLAGPWCTQCFADFGADVLKVEEPTGGDETRTWGPPFMDDMAAYYTCANRSKRSLALDLKDPEGVAMVRRLAAVADVLVENFKLGTMERFGLDAASLQAANPGLIICSISGYGRDGPNADRAGYDFVIQAESGLMSITGDVAGPPTKVGVAVSDLTTGLYASQAILAALFERTRTGKGRVIDIALFDCQLAALANVAANVLATGAPAGRYGNAHANVVPYEVFATADVAMALAIGNDRQFRTLCEKALEAPELAADPRFATNALRSVNRAVLIPRLGEILIRQTAAEWVERLRAYSLPAGPVQSVLEALTSPQAEGRGLVQSLPGETEPVRFVRHPARFSGGLPPARRPPRIGEGGEAAAAEWLADGA